jgi:hypothetical protein
MQDHTIAPAGFRVMAGLVPHGESLVSLAPSRLRAIRLAEQFRDSVLAHVKRIGRRNRKAMSGIRSVWIEEWDGTAVEGRWRRRSSERDGFFYSFSGRSKGGRSKPSSEAAKPKVPMSGDEAECALLSEKTRKGGWRAKLVNNGLSGPITNTGDVPPSAHSGQKVVLVIEAINRDRSRIQFRWVAKPNGKSQ